LSLTLYHSVESTCAQKVRLVLTEKAIPWDEVRLNLRKGDQFKPDYLKLNPKAVVPTLVHDERVVRESSIINEYIDDVFPEPSLKPGDPHARARMRLLIKAFDDEVHPSIGILSYAIFLRHQMGKLKSPEEMTEHFQKIADPMRRERQMRTHDDGLDSPTVPLAVQNLGKVVAQLDDALATGQWLAGDEFSLADATAAPYMVRARALKLDGLWKARPRVGTWLDRAIGRTAGYDLSEPWGSSSLAELVADHAEREAERIQELIAQVTE
jgi:glutathione S-transferase